jgi:hypothetical protein
MRNKFFCPHCDRHVPKDTRTLCPACHADITWHLLIHDAAVVVAWKVVELFEGVLREEERRDAFDECYLVARAGLEAFLQKSGERFHGWVRFSPN